ncbi:MAG: sigma 54-interacting transcriptional regulator [Planctomycetes bacterium]|nr:sigma 54-interacting transcriptional regulator [Planctomycetota bacterium]MCH9725652.1 sigma 54-interacting transcriptional regulator [Planctomycetota bacterium]MCH9777706.1 sigma 54-interacting transcriptional regulator [Planctomycetota bacterium]MCH9793648.1 sigma 54-interacting transcriptional regulator [Planctomycetota bacterium]MDF1742188.1 sigma 54-interacting transcriptional regulator [Gimesia sp.]
MKRGSGRRTRLETRLSSLDTPLFLIDAARTVLFFNQGCEKLLEWPADEILGQTCDYAVHTDADECESICNLLCPPPEVFKGNHSEVPRYLLTHSGKTLPCVIRYTPLLDEHRQTKLVWGIIDPIEATHNLPVASPPQQLHAELAALRLSLRNRFRFSTIIAHNDEMQRVLRQLELVVNSTQPVHFWGEPGTGKEHLARVLHFESEQRRKIFIPLDCDRLPPRELKQTVSKILKREFDEPMPLEPGVLFLSHVESLSRDIQEIILSKYQSATAKDNIRLITASSYSLTDLLEQESILPEFFYLITTMQIKVPPLRERREDLELLAQHFLENENRYQDKQISGFAPGVLSLFQDYFWPTNLDELEKIIQAAFQTTSELLITQESLPLRLRTGIDARLLGPALPSIVKPLEETLYQIEKEQILLALERSKNNRTEAAKLLGLTRAKLYRRMELLNISLD